MVQAHCNLTWQVLSWHRTKLKEVNAAVLELALCGIWMHCDCFLLDRGGGGVCVCVALSYLCFACLITEQSWCEHTLWCRYGIGVHLVCCVFACVIYLPSELLLDPA